MSREWTEHGLPVIGFVGLSGSGKTTFLEKVIGELTQRGWRVATAKHHHRSDFEIDVPGKDSWRHARAGAVVSMIASERKFALVRRVDHEPGVPELVSAAGSDVDILLTESIREPGVRQIEVVRSANSDRVTCRLEDLFALVTDGSHDVGDAPVFSLDDIAGVTALIESVLQARGLMPRDTAGSADHTEGGATRA